MKTYIEILSEVKMKQKYNFTDDGYYSHIVKDDNGEFSTFSKAKKYLIKYTKQRLDEFKYGLSDLPKKESNVDGEGKYFGIYWDGIYSNVDRSNFENGYKNFREAKKEVSDYFKNQIENWKYAWKDAIKLEEFDVD